MRRSNDETERRAPRALGLVADVVRLGNAVATAVAAGDRRRWSGGRETFAGVGRAHGFFPADRF